LLVIAKNGAAIPTLFLIPGQGGSTFNLIKLGRLLNFDGRVAAVPPRGLRRDDKPHLSMKDMVEYYLSVILRCQPRGPYILLGYSLGGVVAFAVAHRLMQTGRNVVFLGLLDSYPDFRQWPFRVQLSVARQRAKYRIGWFLRARFIDSVAFTYWFVTRRWRSSPARFSPPSRRRLFVDTKKELVLIDAVGRAQLKALTTYRPNFYPGKVTFIQPHQLHPALPHSPNSVWGQYVSTLETLVTSGDHESLFQEPFVTHLAHTLSVQIKASLASSTAAAMVESETW